MPSNYLSTLHVLADQPFGLEKRASIDVDDIVYGNSPVEYVEEMNKPNDPIRDWFIKKGHAQRIIQLAPRNSSQTTRRDLELLVKKMEKATSKDVAFARYADDESNLPNLFIDLLKEHGYDETMGGYFGVDNQVSSLLYLLKDTINRPRPYQLARHFGYPIYPTIRTDAMTASYPSGHALTGFVMAEYYSRKFPRLSGKLKSLGNQIAQSRELTGIHYPSDSTVSQEICKIIFDNTLIVER